jgi:lysyl-tRNA synthetase class II
MSEDHSSLRDQRVAKIEALKSSGINPYPLRYDRKDLIADVLQNFSDETRKRFQ